MKQLYAAAALGGILGILAAPPGGTTAYAQGASAPATQTPRVATPYDGLPTSQQATMLSKQVASGELAAQSDA